MSKTQNKKNDTPIIVGQDLRTQAEKDKQQQDQKLTLKKDGSNKSSREFGDRH